MVERKENIESSQLVYLGQFTSSLHIYYIAEGSFSYNGTKPGDIYYEGHIRQAVDVGKRIVEHELNEPIKYCSLEGSEPFDKKSAVQIIKFLKEKFEGEIIVIPLSVMHGRFHFELGMRLPSTTDKTALIKEMETMDLIPRTWEEKYLLEESKSLARNSPEVSERLMEDYKRRYRNNDDYRRKVWDNVFNYLKKPQFAWVISEF